MQERYTFNECYAALHVDPKTFREWLKRDSIEPHRSEADRRVMILTAAQVQDLAQRHGRPWPPVRAEVETIPASAYKILLEQAGQATRQAEQVGEAQAAMRTDLDTIRQEQAANLDRWKATRAALDDAEIIHTTERQEILLHVERLESIRKAQDERISELTSQAEEISAKLEQISASQQEAQQATAAQLDALTRTTEEQAASLDEQQHRLDGLKARIQTEQNARERQAADFLQRLEKQAERFKGMLELQQTRLEGQQTAALEALQKEMQARLEMRARELANQLDQAQQDEASERQALTAQQEQLARQVKDAETRAEAATATALGGQRRLDDLDKRLQAEQEARERQAADFSQRLAAATTASAKALKEQPVPRPARQSKASRKGADQESQPPSRG